MALSAEGIAIFTFIFKLLLGTVFGTTLLCIFVNWSSSLADKDRKEKQEKIANKILKNYSIRNAMLINRETINRNNYVRPEDKSFFEDMIKTEQKEIDPNAPECKIINNVMEYTSSNFQAKDCLKEEGITLSEDINQTYYNITDNSPSPEHHKTLKRQQSKK